MADSSDFVRGVAALYIQARELRNHALRAHEWHWANILGDLMRQCSDELRREQRAVAADQLSFEVRARTRDIGE